MDMPKLTYLQFYNDLAAIFSQFRESCQIWSNSRRQELHSLSHSMQSMSLDADKEAPTVAPQPTKAAATPTRQQKSSRGLPSLNSTDWETEDLPPPPPRVVTKKSKAR
jgi:programmed cell death 6-interacting protein